MRIRKCISCKNNFVGKFHKYKKKENEWYEWAYWEKRWMPVYSEPTNPDELYEEEYCIYTRNYEVYVECSFYNRNPLFVELVQEKELEVDGNGYQDIDRTFTNTERTVSTRIDCQTAQREAAQKCKEQRGKCMEEYENTRANNLIEKVKSTWSSKERECSVIELRDSILNASEPEFE